jgi:hypothetical protein
MHSCKNKAQEIKLTDFNSELSHAAPEDNSPTQIQIEIIQITFIFII